MEKSLQDDEKIEIKWRDWFTRPVWAYKSYMKNSIIPIAYSHQVKMDIPIVKGQRQGTALIPCTIYAMDHSIDLNPALIRKKDKKQQIYLDPKLKYRFLKDEKIPHPFYDVDNESKIVRYNPIHLKLELTDEEIGKDYQLREVEFSEFERCDSCNQKLVIAEVAQTRYRSCPSINVKLGDPAKEDTVVPVQFGFNKSDITHTYWAYPILVFASVGMIGYLWGIDMFSPISELLAGGITYAARPIASNISGTAIATGIGWFLKITITGYLAIFFIPTRIYKGISILKWYNSVKRYVRKNENWSV